MSTTISLPGQKKNYILPLVIIGALFFIFGFVTWANSQLIPYLKIACELSTTQSFLVATAFFAAYFVMALPSSFILKKIGFQRGMSLGLLVMAAGALLFIPAANSRSYPMFLTGLFIIGTGLALLQTASNPYVTVLGPLESAAKRISIMGICNKIAGISAVYILGSIVLKNVDALKAKLLTLDPAGKEAELDTLAARVVNPYVIIAIVLAILAVGIFFIKLPKIEEEEEGTEITHAEEKKNIFQFPHLTLGALAIFFYVGVEVISYDTFSNFGDSLGFATQRASQFASLTGFALLLGYILGITFIPKYISQRNALILSCVLSLFFVLLAISGEGIVSVQWFALLGFSNALMWPAIWPLAIEGLGKFTKTGSALLIMGIAGGAVLPLVYSEVSKLLQNYFHVGKSDSIKYGYLLMIPCYFYILYYATNGYKVGKK